jgi:hypothetical protein
MDVVVPKLRSWSTVKVQSSKLLFGGDISSFTSVWRCHDPFREVHAANWVELVRPNLYQHQNLLLLKTQKAINTKICSSQLDRSLCTPGQTCLDNLSLSFAGPREYRWQGLEAPVMMGKRRGTAQITTTSAGSLRSQLSTQKPALLNSIARCVQQVKHASRSHL